MNPKTSLFIGILCIAFSPIFVKLAVAPPVTSAFYRILIAWIVIAPYCLIKGKLRIRTKELLTALIGGVIFAADIAIWNISLTKMNATISTLVANLAPVWVGILSFLIFKKKSGLSFWAGTLIAIIGMVVLVGLQNLLSMQFNIGLVYALIASVFYAFYIIITKSVLQRINTLVFMFYNMLAASVFLLLICRFEHLALWQFSQGTWGCFLGMGLICQLLGWLTINHALNHLESTRVSIALLGQTIIAGLLAILFLNEKLVLKEIIGSIIVLVGIAVTFIKKPTRLPADLNNAS